LNPDFFITLYEFNLDMTVHKGLPTQSEKLLAFY